MIEGQAVDRWAYSRSLPLPLVSRVLGLLVALVGAAHLAGWLGGFMASQGLHAVTLKVNAALCLLLVGLSLTPAVAPGVRNVTRWTVTALAILAALVGALSLGENLFGWNVGIDQLLAAELPGAVGVTAPNRMGTPGALGILLASVAVLCLWSDRPLAAALGQRLALVVCGIGLLSSIGYLYNVVPLYGTARVTAIAWPTTITLLLLGVALLLARPDEGLMQHATADDAGGALFRRLLLPILVIPLAAGWLRLTGERAGWFDPALGTALVVLLFMLLFTALVYTGARTVSRWEAVRREIQAERERLHAEVLADRERLANDVQERKRTEERLARSEELFRSMFESAAAGMALIELDTGRFIRVNRQLAVLTGYSEDELLRMTTASLAHPEERADATAALVRARSGELNGGYFVERRQVRKNGEVAHVELHGSVIHNGAGQPAGALIVVIDATARKRAERELAAAIEVADRARAQAEEASRAKDHFLSVLSHELRTPLAPILTGVTLLQQDASMPARAASVLEVIHRNVALESRLIDDLLDLTRITRGKVELDRRRVDLCTVIERAVEVCQADLEARRLHFGVDYGPRPYPIDADAARLQQVFWNLLKNAIKFTPKGGCVGVRCRRDDGAAVVEVSDSGIGIEGPALAAVFDPFAQAERSITRQFGGLGLGLTISKALVELHGGRIDAFSEGRNKGAVFSVRLPLATGAGAGAAQFAPAGDSPIGQALEILLVEDHGDTAAMIATLLTSAGHSVTTVGDFGSALDALAAGTFDLVLSDLGLPERSGLELLR